MTTVAATGDEAPARLAFSSITKTYPGTVALNGVTIDLRAGEVHALAGQNGAGKSTLIRILAGVENADGGTISYEGRVVRPRDRDLPIAFIHQDLGLIDTMTVAENLALHRGYARRMGLISWRAQVEAARAMLEAVDCEIDPAKTVSELSMAERSMVAIARAIASKVEVLVLDEPTAALPAGDVETLFAILRKLRMRNVTMLYVTHRMDEIFQLADRVTVLRDGTVVMSEDVAKTSAGELVRAVTGKVIDQVFPKLPPPRPNDLLRIEKLVVGPFDPVDFTVRAGEIVALVGLRGSGHEQVGRAIYGATRRRSGQVSLKGVPVKSRIRGAVAQGLGFASGRRAEEAIAGALTVRENLFLNPGFVRARARRFRTAERSAVRDLIGRFRIWPRDGERVAATLSGGNQQKIVVARWTAADSTILILEEPTAGVDVGAKSDIYRIVGELLESERACILVSSDFDEVAGLAHRALVFNRGRVTRELSGADLSAQQISLYASGGESGGA